MINRLNADQKHAIATRAQLAVKHLNAANCRHSVDDASIQRWIKPKETK